VNPKNIKATGCLNQYCKAENDGLQDILKEHGKPEQNSKTSNGDVGNAPLKQGNCHEKNLIS